MTKSWQKSSLLAGLCLALLLPAMAQTGGTMGAPQQMQHNGAQKPLLSPPEKATVMLNGKPLTIDYSAPSMRGRKIMGGLVPYGRVWRTGANAATTLHAQSSLRIEHLIVPAGDYTLYTVPSDRGWKLIINRQTGQWGTHYNQAMDLGRVNMVEGVIPSHPKELFEIRFEHTKAKSTEMHLLWENVDVYVPIVAID